MYELVSVGQRPGRYEQDEREQMHGRIDCDSLETSEGKVGNAERNSKLDQIEFSPV